MAGAVVWQTKAEYTKHTSMLSLTVFAPGKLEFGERARLYITNLGRGLRAVTGYVNI